MASKSKAEQPAAAPNATTAASSKTTLLDSFYGLVEKYPDERFMTQPGVGGAGEGEGNNNNNTVKYWTFKEALVEAKKVAAYLDSLDLPPKSQIAICSKNCSWWILADLAIWMSGHVSVPVYPTLTGDTVRYILEHSESKLLFVGKLDDHPWNEMKSGVPAGMPTVTFPLNPGLDDAAIAKNVEWDDILRKFEPIAKPATRNADEMATIIYTSGSTGQPKGVMHDFGTMLQTTVGIESVLKPTRRDRYLSYLPLAHGMERWTGECIALHVGQQVFFAEALSTFVDDLNRSRPTLFLSVPRT